MRAGFTLIEILIVVAISALLAGLVITYSSVGRNEVALSVQSTAIAQTLSRAKSLAIAAYGSQTPGAPHVCGYGVAFDFAADTYSLVSYEPASGKCSDASAVRSGGVPSAELHSYSSDTWHRVVGGGLQLRGTGSAGPAAALVLFYPPDPTTLVSTDLCIAGDAGCTYTFPLQPGTIYLLTSDNSAAQNVTIGTAGQISW